MALSYYSNLGGVFQSSQLGSDVNGDDDSALPPELLGFPSMDYLFETNDLFYSGNPTSLQHDCSNGVIAPFDNLNYLAAETLLLQQDLEPFHYPKRQKGCDYEEICSNFRPAFFNGFVPNPSLALPEYSPPEVALPPLPDFPTAPPGHSGGSWESPARKEPSTVSSQSIAARQRRRKITEKTQELGKLVPGGQKMNTAEMLQAAYKYIKFLQAQVGILEFNGSCNQVDKEASDSHGDELHDLLESPLIQEKLYSTEKCLVPQEFVEELGRDRQMVKSNPALLPLMAKQERS